ncbi:MAG: branched-chain amino acid aminotransferase [Gammaproteobacteria bacterium]|jgi:branched-chain amino acid aminotransferase
MRHFNETITRLANEEDNFTGTATEVLPIQSLDGRRGPVTEKLQNMYFDTVTGKAPFKPEWLTLVK